MNLQMDPLYNPLGTRPIQTGREMSMEPYPNRPFRFIDDPDCKSGSGSVPTCTRTRSDGPDPVLTLSKPGGRNHESLGMDLETVIKRIWRYT